MSVQKTNLNKTLISSTTSQQASTRIVINNDLLVIYIIETNDYEWSLKEIISIEQELMYDVYVILSTADQNVIKKFEENKVNFINVDKTDMSYKLKLGFKYAFKNGYKYTVQFNDDHQYNYKEIEKLHQKVLRGFDIIVGNRNGNSTFRMSQANKLVRKSLGITSMFTIDDPLCYFRLFNWNAMRLYLKDAKLKAEPYSYAYLKRHEKIKLTNQPVSIRKNNFSYQNKANDNMKFALSQSSKILFNK